MVTPVDPAAGYGTAVLPSEEDILKRLQLAESEATKSFIKGSA